MSEVTKEMVERQADLQEYCERERFSLRLPRLFSICLWTYDDVHQLWSTGCDKAFFLESDTPTENDFLFCTFCGHVLIEKTEEVADG